MATSSPRRPADPRTTALVRGGLFVLAFSQGALAVWALIAPRGFYNAFPGGGHAWVSPLGPYDEHLVRDVGALSLALTAVLVAALITADRRLVIVGAIAYLAWELPHLSYHLTADGPLPTEDRIASEAGQALVALIAAAVLVTAIRRPTEPDDRR
jgi:hypothetical protein